MNEQETTRGEETPTAQNNPPPASSSGPDPRVPLQYGERAGVPGVMGEGRPLRFVGTRAHPWDGAAPTSRSANLADKRRGSASPG